MLTARVPGGLLPAAAVGGIRSSRRGQQRRPAGRPTPGAGAATREHPLGQPQMRPGARVLIVRSAAGGLADLPPGVVGARGKVTKSGLDKLTIMQLRGLCAARNLSCQGRKMALVERLLSELSDVGLEAQSAMLPPEATPPPAEKERPHQAAASTEPLAVSSSSRRRNSQPVQDEEAPASGAVMAAGVSKSQRQYGTEAQRSGNSRQATGVAVTWLGSSSGAPTQARNVSCTAVELGPAGVVLVDCGEGAKRQLARSHIDPLDIRCICITHMHGDHCFGIPGVLNALSHRKQGNPEEEAKPIVIYGPPGTFSWVETAIRAGSIQLSMRVLVVELHKAQEYSQKPRQMDESGKLWMSKAVPTPESAAQARENISDTQSAGGAVARKEEHRLKAGVVNGLTWNLQLAQGFHLQAAQLLHRVPCFGFCFTESRKMVPVEETGAIIMGNPEEFQASIPGRKVLILGDTCDSTSISGVAMRADVVSHEATFSDGMEQKAAVACHSTARMAGAFAKSIGASNLFLTHFSPRFQVDASWKGGKPGPEDSSPSDGNDITAGDINAIVRQAKQGFGSDNVFPVKDFLTFHVPAKQPQIRRQAPSQRSMG